jgi:acetyltransferase-like isoleucine patch superfamily enzyme
MRKDHRPYSLKILQGKIEALWVKHFIAPQLEAIGHHSMIMKPWFLKIYGKEIRFGKSVHVITAPDRNVRLTTWEMNEHQGKIDIKDYVLICPGVRIDSASSIEIGASTMLAAGVYITDSDWHGIYDRTQAIGRSSPVKLASNVWIGDGTTVCKGVSIGENSIIGAGSVVANNIPANVIAAGNPARVIKELDPEQQLTNREDMLEDGVNLALQMDGLERWMRQNNTWLRWLRALLAPSNKD